ncbi:MAG TPA: TonB family protein, partial [Solimonas sp.]|nr:TonB family protein [Solimonas sp.]
KQLQGDFKQIEQQQRRAEDESAARERQRQEADRAERAAAAAAEQERLRAREAAMAAERKREEPAARPTPVAAAARPARPAVRVDPSIDWSSCRRPEYPSFSVTRKEEGVVTVGVDVDASGKVKDSRIAESSGHRQLDTAAQRAISRCSFSPATVDGTAQAASALVRFAWKLN